MLPRQRFQAGQPCFEVGHAAAGVGQFFPELFNQIIMKTRCRFRAFWMLGDLFQHGAAFRQFMHRRQHLAIERRLLAGEHVHVHNIRSDYVNNQVDFFEAADVAEGAAS